MRSPIFDESIFQRSGNLWWAVLYCSQSKLLSMLIIGYQIFEKDWTPFTPPNTRLEVHWQIFWSLLLLREKMKKWPLTLCPNGKRLQHRPFIPKSILSPNPYLGMFLINPFTKLTFMYAGVHCLFSIQIINYSEIRYFKTWD